jgi:hypothetical protein
MRHHAPLAGTEPIKERQMRRSSKPVNRLLAVGLAVAVAVAGVTAVALAAGGAQSSAVKVKIRCPKTVKQGNKVTCRLFGRLRGPQGARGPKGATGARGKTGARGPAGNASVAGYETVSQTFADLAVPNSGTASGLSNVVTVSCPGGKRVLGGGANLGTDPEQTVQHRTINVSLSGPNGNGTGWSVQLFNNATEPSGDASIDVRVYATCARAN